MQGAILLLQAILQATYIENGFLHLSRIYSFKVTLMQIRKSP